MIAARHETSRIVHEAVLAEIDAVAAAASGDRRPVRVVVCGASGTGVSTVAARWARRGDRAVLRVPALVDGEGPTLQRVIIGWLRMLGVPAAVLPVRTAELARLWRAECDRRRPTLLLDAAVTRLAVGLAPWCGEAALLVTTDSVEAAQELCDRHGFARVDVPDLEDDQVRLLLLDAIGDRAGLDVLVAGCRGHLHTTVLAVAALSAGNPVDAVLGAVTAKPLYSGPVSGPDPLTRMVLAGLPTNVRALVRGLSALGGVALTAGAAAAIPGVGAPADAQRAIACAAAAGLLTQPEPRRWRLHSRVQQTWSERPGTDSGEKAAAVMAVAELMLLRVAAADRLLGAPGDIREHPAYAQAVPRVGELVGSADTARRWLLAEHTGIAALTVRLQAAACTVSERWRAASLLAGFGEAVHAWRSIGDPWTWQGISDRALGAATEHSPTTAALTHGLPHAEALISAGSDWTMPGSLIYARELADAALSTARSVGDACGAARALLVRAHTLAPAPAADFAEAARLATDPAALAEVHLCHATLALRGGDADTATRAAAHAVAIAETVGGLARAGLRAHGHLLATRAALTRGDAAEATEHAHGCLAVVEAIPNGTPLTEPGQILAWQAHLLAAHALLSPATGAPNRSTGTAGRCPVCAAANSPTARFAGHRAAARSIGPNWPAPPAPAVQPGVVTDWATTTADLTSRKKQL